MIDNTFQLKELLGIGGSSKVYNSTSNDGQEYAIKIVRKDKGYSEEIAKKIVENEHFLSLKLGQHPNLVNILGYNTDGRAQLADGVHSINYLLMERCKNGSLSNIIRKTGPLEENITKFLFLQLCSAVKFIHENFIHMDIKLENILLDDYFNVKLADLGTVVDISETMGYTNKRRGTLNYMAPEVINMKQSDNIDGRLSDIYSPGVCLHLLLTGEFPDKEKFSDECSVETESSDEIINEPQKREKGIISFLSQDARDLLSEMLSEDAFFRIDMDQILSHPWLAESSSPELQEQVFLEMKARSDYIGSISDE